MRLHIFRGLLIVTVLLCGSFLVSGAKSASSSAADENSVSSVEDRSSYPVVITGLQALALSGAATEDLFVYVFRDNQWTQIPAQVDEVAADGSFTAVEDGLLDYNDEIVFMAGDLGVRSPSGTSLGTVLPISSAWYEIEVTDPLTPGQRGWAYVVLSDVLNKTHADYVRFDPGLHRIITNQYSLALSAVHDTADFLTLGANGIDILDRTKLYVDCGIPVICPLKETLRTAPPDNLVTDGPVRVILRGGQLVAYRSMLNWSQFYDNFPAGSVRFSVDFNAAVIGATHYHASVPQGVQVDGIDDFLAASPFEGWWQMSTNMGTVVQVVDTSVLPEALTYYVDNAIYDPSDTGDRLHFGDAGIIIPEPPDQLTYAFSLYFLPGREALVGPTYAAFEQNPLLVTPRLQGVDPFPYKVFLPVFQVDLHGDDYDDFYDPPDLGQPSPDRLGEVLRMEHIRSYTSAEVSAAAGLPSSSFGAESYRILYLSQDESGVPIAISGILVVPVGPVPASGFPVMAYGHFRPDMADQCAPSRTASGVSGLLPWISQGYVVSATDYAGFGTPGPRPLMVSESSAHAMLDSARAALRFRDPDRFPVDHLAGNNIILQGHSLGGHAVLSAHQYQESYAPDLNLLGTIGTAPVTELRLLARNTAHPPSPQLPPLVLTMYAYSQTYGAPTAPQSWLKEPYATDLSLHAETECVPNIYRWLGTSPDQVLRQDWLSAVRENRWDDLHPWTDYIDENTPGSFTSDAPVLVLQGLTDTLNPPEASEQLVQRLCDHETSTSYRTYPGTNHFTLPRAGLWDAIEWANARLAGAQMTDDCTTR